MINFQKLFQLQREKSFINEEKRKVVLEKKKAMTDLTVSEEPPIKHELHDDNDTIKSIISTNVQE